MIQIPQNIQELNTYIPGKPVEQIKKELGLSEIAVLWNNENNLGVSPKVSNAISEATSHSNLYPDPTCYSLRNAIAEKSNCDWQQVSIANGSEEILSNLNKAFLSEDDEILTTEGTFVAVYIWAKASNVNLRKIPLLPNYGIDLEGILQSITSKTKIIYLSNANNPTGAIIEKSDLVAFLNRVPEHIIVVVDEAYFEYSKTLSNEYPDATLLGFENVIVLRTFSKAYGLAGIRVGYSIAPVHLTEPLMKVKMTFAPSNIALAAAEASINDEETLRYALSENKKGIELFQELFDSLNYSYIKSYANFVTLTLESVPLAEKLFENLYNNGVFVRHLKAFGLPNCVRVSVGTEKENNLFVKVFTNLNT